jgi:starch synthase
MLSFDAELAHLACGLVQMIAMKYGTVPVARSTGGLADTVFDRDDSARPVEAGTGRAFLQADDIPLDPALRRALRLWREHADELRKLILNGMRYDYSWRKGFGKTKGAMK